MSDSANASTLKTAWTCAGENITRYRDWTYRKHAEAAALAVVGGVVGHQIVSRMLGGIDPDFIHVNPWPAALTMAAFAAATKLPAKINKHGLVHLGLLATLVGSVVGPAYFQLLKPSNDLTRDRTALVEEIRKDESLGKGTKRESHTMGSSGFVATSSALVTNKVDFPEFGGACREVVVDTNTRNSINENFLLCPGGKIVRFAVAKPVPEVKALGKRTFEQWGDCDIFSMKSEPAQSATLYARCGDHTYSLWAQP